MLGESEKLKVVIADADAEVLQYLGSIFRSLECNVQPVGKLRSLKSQLKARPDVLVLDLIMPGQDGIQILESMAEARLDTAIIIVSACPDRILNAAENYARMSGLRVLGALRKPVWRDQIRELLEPLRQRGNEKPHLEEQEFFRLLETGHLEVHFKPVIDVRRAAVHALEAAPRVRHPKLGVLSPTGMWDTAEAFGAAEKIKDNLLDLSIKAAAQMAREGVRVPIQCEVPATQLVDPGFADQFLDRCRANSVLPSSICIVVTESETRQNFTPALGTLTRLAMRGVEISVNDFGIGSLSGGMLARMPVHEIKIASALAAAILRDAEARYRALDIVAYGERQDLRVVAKGIESPEHLGLLIDLGMALFQGNLISSAKSFEEIVYWQKNAAQHLAKLGITSAIRVEAG
ncbi:MAG: EAL domain-containing protein [Pseudomonadota bacterium]